MVKQKVDCIAIDGQKPKCRTSSEAISDTDVHIHGKQNAR